MSTRGDPTLTRRGPAPPSDAHVLYPISGVANSRFAPPADDHAQQHLAESSAIKV